MLLLLCPCSPHVHLIQAKDHVVWSSLTICADLGEQWLGLVSAQLEMCSEYSPPLGSTSENEGVCDDVYPSRAVGVV